MFGARSKQSSWIELDRDVTVIQIPAGDEMHLEEGQKVRIHQELGGQYTLMTEWGYLVRLDARNADAIGKEPRDPSADEDTDKPLEDRIWDALKQCYDPEIPINIVDLGLVYSLSINEGAGPEGGAVVGCEMTLTAPGCGMGDVLAQDARTAIESVTGVDRANVEIVFSPPWDRSMMSEEAMLELGFL